MVQETLGRLLLPELKLSFAPSPYHFWEFITFRLSPRTFGLQCKRSFQLTELCGRKLQSTAVHLQFVRQYAPPFVSLYPPGFQALNKGKPKSTPLICTSVRLSFVPQYASHLYGSTFQKVLRVGVTGKFPRNRGQRGDPAGCSKKNVKVPHPNSKHGEAEKSANNKRTEDIILPWRDWRTKPDTKEMERTNLTL